MRILARPLAFFLCALLAACANQPPTDWPQGGVDVPAAWAQTVPEGAAPLSGWWRVFEDRELSAFVRSAVVANTDIAAAQYNVFAAQSARDAAAASLRPHVNATLDARRAAAAGSGDRNSFQAGLDAGWDADLFGANRFGLAGQEALLQAAGQSQRATQLTVIAQLVQSYVELRATQVRIVVARENLASQEETLQIAQWRQQAGLANAIEVEQARTAVEQTRAQVPSLQSAAAQYAHAVAVLAGQRPEDQLKLLAATPSMPRVQEDVLVPAPVQVVLERPDVQAAQQRVQAAARFMQQSQARQFASLDLGASLAWSGLTLGSVGAVSAARSVFLSLAQPLFDGGALQAQRGQREQEWKVALSNYRGAVLGALKDVEDALVAVAAARQRLASLEGALDAARNAALLATQRQASGLVDFQTVLETQRTRLNVEDSVALAQLAVATEHVRLYQALGGWQYEHTGQAEP